MGRGLLAATRSLPTSLTECTPFVNRAGLSNRQALFGASGDAGGGGGGGGGSGHVQLRIDPREADVDAAISGLASKVSRLKQARPDCPLARPRAAALCSVAWTPAP